MPKNRSLFLLIFCVLTAAGWSQDPGASPSAKPFIVDPTEAEKEQKRDATPTPTPDTKFLANPMATAAPVPSAAPVSEDGVARAMPASQQEVITRLQIFLDQRSFGPGKIDGRWGEFTAKALLRYQISQGQPVTGRIDDAMEQELARIYPIYTNYTLTDEDLRKVANIPSKPVDQAKVKAMLYRSLVEFLGERFHSDEEFISKLNKGIKVEELKPGDIVRVPNVQPFKIEEMKENGHIPIKPELTKRLVKIDTRYRMLDIYQGERLLYSFPITPGSKKLPAPIGTWRIVGIATLPWFRWDAAMLEHGYRSETFYNIPPGPRNPVGILWIGLNKNGIGIHGTNSPDTIGRSGSHGCIRLANWDAARVVDQVTEGMTVQIF